MDKGEEDDDDYQKEKETTNDRKHNGYTFYDNIIISFIVVSRLFVFKSHAVSSAYYLEYRTARIPVNDILYDPLVKSTTLPTNPGVMQLKIGRKYSHLNALQRVSIETHLAVQ